MNQSRSLKDADPVLAEKAVLVMEEFSRRAGFPWSLMITSVWRSQLVQEALYVQGRAPLEVVNKTRRLVNLAPINEDGNKIVTYRRTTSKHSLRPSRAVDFAVVFDSDGSAGPIKPVIVWDDEARYRLMGRIATKNGLIWGGDFRKPDMAHVELPDEV